MKYPCVHQTSNTSNCQNFTISLTCRNRYQRCRYPTAQGNSFQHQVKQYKDLETFTANNASYVMIQKMLAEKIMFNRDNNLYKV